MQYVVFQSSCRGRERERELIALFLLPSVVSVLCLPHDGVNLSVACDWFMCVIVYLHINSSAANYD